MSTSGTAAAPTATVTDSALPAPSYSLGARLAAEALGSFVLVFAGLGTAVFNGSQSAVPVGFAFGLALMAAVIAFGHISGGYFNPAVSLGLAITGRLKWLDMVWYWILQIVGAVAAAVVLFAVMKVMPAFGGGSGKLTTESVFNSLANGFDAHSPNAVPLIGVFLIETVGTAVFVAVILGATSRHNATTLAPVGIGLAMAVVITVALPLSNASINPARSTAVVFFSDAWPAQQLWLFWVAPLFGGALAAVIFRVFAMGAPAPVRAGNVSLEDATDNAGAGTVAGNGEAPEAAPAVPVRAAAPDTTEAQDFFDGEERSRNPR